MKTLREMLEKLYKIMNIFREKRISNLKSPNITKLTFRDEGILKTNFLEIVIKNICIMICFQCWDFFEIYCQRFFQKCSKFSVPDFSPNIIDIFWFSKISRFFNIFKNVDIKKKRKSLHIFTFSAQKKWKRIDYV